jgi:serpin B
MSLEDVNISYRSLIDLLRQLDPNVNFQLANSIWYRQDFEVESTFVELNKTYFDAAVQALDFADPSALVTINNWVNTNTNGKIKTILDRIPDEALMYLINAIYFKGAWTTQFDARKTRDWSFTLSDGSTKSCRMMYMSDADFTYFAAESFSAADLKYGSGDYSMTILLPNVGVNLDSLVEQMTNENWQGWLAQLRPVTIDLGLPKFELEYKLRANDVLEALGMGIAFSDAADFTGINRIGRLFISEVAHKTFVKVDEEGTEAAAVTSVEIRPTSISPSFMVDHPFVFVIHENRSGTILFMGKIVDPT